MRVRGLADDLRSAAAIAQEAEERLFTAKRTALSAIGRAQATGFIVNEDLSVASREQGGPPAAQAARQAQVRSFATELRSQAAALEKLDQQIASEVAAAASGIADVGFNDDATPDDVSDTNGRDPTIRLVDRTFTQGPAPHPTPGGPTLTPVPTALSIQDAIRDLPYGTKQKIRLVRDPAQLEQLQAWMMQHSTDFNSGTPYRGGEGVERVLPDGTVVRFGTSRKFGPTSGITIPVDEITPPTGDTIKLHIDGEKGGLMRFPTGVIEGPPPAELSPPPPVRPATPWVEPPPQGGRPPLGGMPGSTKPSIAGPPISGGYVRPMPGIEPRFP